MNYGQHPAELERANKQMDEALAKLGIRIKRPQSSSVPTPLPPPPPSSDGGMARPPAGGSSALPPPEMGYEVPSPGPLGIPLWGWGLTAVGVVGVLTVAWMWRS